MVVMEKHVGPSDRVDRYFREILARTDHGERLPSVRQAMRECRVSRVIVDRALARFQGEGLIETRERSGLYRTGGIHNGRRVVDLLYFGFLGCLDPGSFHNDYFSTLTVALAERSQSLRMRVMLKDPDPKGYVSGLVRERPGQLIVCEANVDSLGLVEKLKEAGIRYLHLFPNMIEPISPSLVVDDEDILRHQLGHLRELGHRRVGFFHAVNPKHFARPIWLRKLLFYQMACEHGLEVRPEWVRCAGWQAEGVRSEVRAVMGGADRPTGLVIYDNHVNPVYSELRAMGLEPGRDVSVVGTDDLPHASHVDPGLTTVQVSRTTAAAATLEMMDALEAGKEPGIQRLKTKLIVRGSTGKAQ